jgi:hypothetical protein
MYSYIYIYIYISTHAQKLYIMTNNICMSTYILSATINRHTQGDVNGKK